VRRTTQGDLVELRWVISLIHDWTRKWYILYTFTGRTTAGQSYFAMRTPILEEEIPPSPPVSNLDTPFLKTIQIETVVSPAVS